MKAAFEAPPVEQPKRLARIPLSVCEKQLPPDEVPIPSDDEFNTDPSFCTDCRIDLDICPTCNREPRACADPVPDPSVTTLICTHYR